ncbi:hypothetical protein [Paracidovorax konjaci]|uniref:hypothetical protein n=1 Tax=Paracidovorax konjaci TaxID=32040 RepID=UPI001113EC35|nr:hypothetical protein [Paracidovorax konjaci]
MKKDVQECNQKCRAKYANWSESKLRERLLALDIKESPFAMGNITKEELITKICAVECGVIEQGWRA